MERVKSSRARKRVVDPVTHVDVNKADTMKVRPSPDPKVDYASMLRINQEANWKEVGGLSYDDPRPIPPPRARTWWELLTT